MGSPDSELGRGMDETQHEVTLTRAFLLQVTEVTQEQYLERMGENPSAFIGYGDDFPVEWVTWFDAMTYANAMSRTEGLPPCYDARGTVVGGATVYACEGYRLPTEAEWEYAARAGTTTATYAGELTDTLCEDQTLPSIAWFCGNAGSTPHPVGQKTPNDWGLYDMLGNVGEWTSDGLREYGGAVIDPTGATGGGTRVARGGGWEDRARVSRAAGRYAFDAESRGNGLGFRLARTLP